MGHHPLGRRLWAEALGTGLLVATVVGSGIMADKLAAGNDAVALLGNTIPTAAILYVLITIFGPVSGAHFNPAVSLVFAARRDLPWAELGPYVATQIGGAVLGTLAAHAMFDLAIVQISATARNGLAQWLSEMVATFSLMLAILGALRARPEAVPAIVALVITAAYWFTASTSFANPAVTIGRAFSDTFAGVSPLDAPAFIAAQIAGALLASVMATHIFGWSPQAPAESAAALDEVRSERAP
jgi:glycerol uptake facilitator-like aquaporin